MTQSYVLVRDDDTDTTTNRNPNRRNLFSKDRSKHVFTITSPVDQKIYVSGYTWSLRTYPNACKDGPQSSEHYFIVTDKDNNNKAVPDSDRVGKWLFMRGHSYYNGFTMKKDQQLEVEFAMDWSEKESHDFSLVVWGTSNQQTIITADFDYTNARSGHWPFTPMLADDQNAEQESTADRCKENP
jgi:hypothetical protein